MDLTTYYWSMKQYFIVIYELTVDTHESYFIGTLASHDDICFRRKQLKLSTIVAIIVADDH